MSDEGKIRDSKLTDRFDWNSRDGVTYSADDWDVVEDALAQHTEGYFTQREDAEAALARLREREAQLERERDVMTEHFADAARHNEARAEDYWKALQAEGADREAAEARIARLEEALREYIAADLDRWKNLGNKGEPTGREYAAARRALAHNAPDQQKERR